MTTWKGVFDRLELFIMGDRRARNSEAVLNVVTAAGIVRLVHSHATRASELLSPGSK